MAIPDVSAKCRELLRKELSLICQSLLNVLTSNTSDNDTLSKAERFGEIVLMQTTIFDTANIFVESHHQVQFFGLWEIDSLMVQFLKNKPY